MQLLTSGDVRPVGPAGPASLVPVAASGTHAILRPDRRHAGERARLVNRIRTEYKELPGLRLSVRQAARLFAVDCSRCGRVLDECVREGWLCSGPGGLYALRSAPH